MQERNLSKIKKYMFTQELVLPIRSVLYINFKYMFEGKLHLGTRFFLVARQQRRGLLNRLDSFGFTS